MANNVTPIHARRIYAELGRFILREALVPAEARLRSFDCGDDHALRYSLDLMADHLWRLPCFAEGTEFEAECLQTLKYIASEFEMTPANLKVLSMCLDIKDDQYRDASEGAA